MPPVYVRDALPDALLQDVTGRRALLRDLMRSRPMAVFLFHAECVSCRRRLGEFAAAMTRYDAHPAAVIAVCLDSEADLRALVDEVRPNFPVVRDPDRRLCDRLAPTDPATGRRQACCAVTDALAEIFAVLRGEDAVEQEAIHDWLDFIGRQCSE